MIKLLTIIWVILVVTNLNAQHKNDSMQKFVLVVHGGAGAILKKNMTEEQEMAYTAKLSEALKAGYDILKNGGTSIDAVETALIILENSPLFNAGKGSVFTNDGKNEMDASIMDGKTIKAGAVAGVRTIKNPIKAARKVMEKSPHVLMVGKGAEQFAEEQNVEIVDTSYFYDEKRFQQLQKIKDSEKIKLDHDDGRGELNPLDAEFKDQKFGTVGAVALDKHGNLAAGTSTGGMTNKKYGRVGDSPIIGAGTYANNKTCAVSATGHGEYFIRAVAAYDISALMEYKELTLEKAANEVVLNKLVDMDGEGGVIAVDQNGNIAMPFNTDGMYRGYVNNKGEIIVKIYKE